jgi:hypothetical protein
MPTRATTLTPDILEGRITDVRVAIPVHRGVVHLRVDGVPVNATIEDAGALRTLQDLQRLHSPVRIGVLTDDTGAHRFAWLVCPGKPGIAPRRYGDEQRRSARAIGGGLALAVVALGAAWVIGIGAAWRALVVSVMLAFVLMGAVFAGIGIQSMWRARVSRPALLASDAAYLADDGRPPKTAPLPEAPAVPVVKGQHHAGPAASSAKGKRGARAATPPAPGVDARVADDGQPPIGHVRGPLSAVTHESVRSINGGPAWSVYRFNVGATAYVMTVGDDVGHVMPFVAEGDRVELAVHAADSPRQDRHRIVYAMRNLEDGRVYVCHRTFRGARADMAPIGVGLTQQAPLLRAIAGFLVVVWLILLGVFGFAGSSDGLADLPAVATWGLLVGVVVWGGIALPFVMRERRWRQGRPTRRQHTLERIYRVLGLGTPLAPAVPIEEV